MHFAKAAAFVDICYSVPYKVARREPTWTIAMAIVTVTLLSVNTAPVTAIIDVVLTNSGCWVTSQLDNALAHVEPG